MNRENPKVGQTVYSLNVGNAARRSPQVLTPVIVTKVGRKYFEVKRKGSAWPVSFHLITWAQKTDYAADHNLYASEQEWCDEVEAEKLNAKLRAAFGGYGRCKCALGTLRKIAALLDDEKL